MDSIVEAPRRLRRRARWAGWRAGRRHLPHLGALERDTYIAGLQGDIDANAEKAVRHAYEALDPIDQQIAAIEGRMRRLEALAALPGDLPSDAGPDARRDHDAAVARAEEVRTELVGLEAELARLAAARSSVDEAHRAAARSTAKTLGALGGVYWTANFRARKVGDLEIPDLALPFVPDVLLRPLPRSAARHAPEA